MTLAMNTSLEKMETKDRVKHQREQLPLQGEVNSQTGTPKRLRSDASWPLKDREVNRGRVANPVDSNSQLKLGIVSQGFSQEKFNTEQAMPIEAAFEIKNTGIKRGDIIPRFEDCRYKNHLLTVICLVEMSGRWLIQAEGDLKLCKDARIKAIDSNALPESAKFVSWIPGTSEEPSSILKMLAV